MMKEKKVIFICSVIIILVIGIVFILYKYNSKSTQISYSILGNENDVKEFRNKEKDNIIVDNRISKEETYKINVDGRGYILVENEQYYYLTIYYDWLNCGYSSFDVKKVEINGKDVKITVKEPKTNNSLAFTHPNVTIKFNEKPEQIEVIYL